MTRIGSAIAVASVVFGAFHQTRDAAPTAADGTAQVSGIVSSGGIQPGPIRRAVVTLTGPELPIGRSAITDDQGRFSIGGVPAGRYSLSASKPAYLTANYGARRAGQPGIPLDLASSQRMSDLTLTMLRGAAIGGTIRDGDGRPKPDVRVSVFRKTPGGGFGSAPVNVRSDDRGQYRCFGLAPGSYVVAASLGFAGEQVTMAAREVDAILAVLEHRQGTPRGAEPPAKLRTSTEAPVFYPGVLDPAEAQLISLTAGDDQAADIVMTPSTTAAVDGLIIPPAATLPDITITMAQNNPGLPMPTGRPFLFHSAGDSRFRFTNVAPGSYTISALTTGADGRPGRLGGAGDSILWASQDVVVRGDDIDGVTLALQPAHILAGRLAFDPATATRPSGVEQVRISLFASNSPLSYTDFGWLAPARASATGVAMADGTFRLTGVVPGRYNVRVQNIPTGWTIRSAIAGGKDVLDEPLVIGGGRSPDQMTITLTDRHTSLAGSLQVPATDHASTYVIVVFPADRALWRAGSRRVTAARAGAGSAFQLLDIPPGEYLVGALADFDPDDLADPSFFEKLAGQSVKVTIGEGEQKIQNLRIAGSK